LPDEEGKKTLMQPWTGDVVFGITVNWWSVLAVVVVIGVGLWLRRRLKRGSKASGDVQSE
jgi:hypothetical protein